MSNTGDNMKHWIRYLWAGLGIFSIWFVVKLITSSPIPVLPDLTIQNFQGNSVQTASLTNIELTPVDEKIKGVL